MSHKENIREELEQESPFLARMKAEDKSEGFTVPPTYFRELQEDVLHRVAQKPAAVSLRERWQAFINHLLPGVHPVAVLTGLALVVVGIWWVAQDTTMVSGEQILAEASEEELQAYVTSNTDAFTTDLILEVADEEAELDLLLPVDNFSEEEADQLLDDLLEEIDESTLQEIL